MFCGCSFGGGCATIVNDKNIPVNIAFSDGSSGTCNIRNKRGGWSASVPSQIFVRRSDDVLALNCKTADGRETATTVESDIEDSKFVASIFFFDLGITDAITDSHRKYPNQIIVPVPARE